MTAIERIIYLKDKVKDLQNISPIPDDEYVVLLGNIFNEHLDAIAKELEEKDQRIAELEGEEKELFRLQDIVNQYLKEAEEELEIK